MPRHFAQAPFDGLGGKREAFAIYMLEISLLTCLIFLSEAIWGAVFIDTYAVVLL